MTKQIEVPYEQLESESLRAMIEEYITRDGTFYGDVEMSMDHKIDMIVKQLESNEAVITWDLDLQTGTLVLKTDMEKKRGKNG